MSFKFLRPFTRLNYLVLLCLVLLVTMDITFHIQPKFNEDSHSERLMMILDDSVEEVSELIPIPANKLIKANQPPSKFRKIASQDLPPEMKSDWVKTDKEIPVSRFPGCLLVGFSKCGTSSLLSFLNLHPHIVSLDWETDYFCDRVYFKYSLHWYRMRMPPSTSNQVTIEKSPCYISEWNALERIRAFNSSIKIMVILRNPITRILSQHGQYLASFKTVGKTKQTLEERYIDPKTQKLNNGALEKWGIFTTRMENLLSVFRREQIHIVDGDLFIKDPLPVLKGIEHFLGVQKFFSGRDYYFDHAKGFFCPRDRNSKQTQCMGIQKGRTHVEITPKLNQLLRNRLRPHTEKLFQIINQRLDWKL